MNDERLRIYLADHMALIVGEIELAARCRSNNQGTPLGEFLTRLEADLKSQQTAAKKVLHKVGGAQSLLKEGAAWFAEKLGRLKLNDALLSYSSLSRVEELETLAAAAQERVALWDSLTAIAEGDRRLASFDFLALRNAAKKHLSGLNTRRRRAAVEAFAGK